MTTTTTVAGAILARDYPDHVCPESIEPHGDHRVGYHGQGEGTLMMVCMISAACGCRITGNGTLMHPMMIEPCSGHRAAMYPSLAI